MLGGSFSEYHIHEIESILDCFASEMVIKVYPNFLSLFFGFLNVGDPLF